MLEMNKEKKTNKLVTTEALLRLTERLSANLILKLRELEKLVIAEESTETLSVDVNDENFEKVNQILIDIYKLIRETSREILKNKELISNLNVDILSADDHPVPPEVKKILLKVLGGLACNS